MKSNRLSQSINSTKFFCPGMHCFVVSLSDLGYFLFLEARDRMHNRSLPLGGDHAGNPKIPGLIAELVSLFIHLFF